MLFPPLFRRSRSPRRRLSFALVLAAGGLILAIASAAHAQPPLTPHRYLPGDEVYGPPPERQDWPRVAAGSVPDGSGGTADGFLAVWQDTRTVLSGFTNFASTLNGNETDVYGVRLAADGSRLDADPLLIGTQGRDQERPLVAWGGDSWLVVWTSERPDWYFFEDIVAVRVAADGTVLDAQPIPLRLENNDPANDRGEAPQVVGNGNGWLVVWQELVWTGNFFLPAVGGVRVAADGTMIDPEPVILHVHSSPSFGPREPQVVLAGDEYLVVWEEAANNGLRGKRFDLDLQPLDPQPFLIDSSALRPRVATDGVDFLVASSSRRVFRVTHAGQVLDPGGISLGSGHQWQGQATEVAWDGTDWVATFPSSSGAFSEPGIWAARVTTSGTILPPGSQPVFDTAVDEEKVALAPVPGGGAQLVWTEKDFSQGLAESVHSGRLAADGTTGPARQVSVGLARQAWPGVTTAGGEHMVVFLSQGDGLSRVMAQRLSAAGLPLDAEPTVVAEYPETTKVFPDISFDGTRYLVAWSRGGEVIGRRLSSSGRPIDPAPVPLIQDAAGALGVGGMSGQFLIAYTHAFSGDQSNLHGITVGGGDLAVSSPTLLGGNYARAPRVETLGDRWLVVWERQVNHDTSTSSIYSTFVDATGLGNGVTVVDGAGLGDAPGIAVAGDRALVVWHDNDDFNNASIEGRVIAADGTFLGGELLIADAANDQFFPEAAFDGGQFLVAWNDFRHVSGVVQMRAEVYASRVALDGTVIDPGGFPLTASAEPEDLPVVAGAGGSSVVLYSKLAGPAGPQIQRIAYRVLGAAAPQPIFADGFESGDMSQWSTALSN